MNPRPLTPTQIASWDIMADLANELSVVPMDNEEFYSKLEKISSISGNLVDLHKKSMREIRKSGGLKK